MNWVFWPRIPPIHPQKSGNPCRGAKSGWVFTKSKMANRNLGPARAPLGDRAPCVQSSRKSGVPRAQATHHRLRLTETVSLLQKLWGDLWICQSGAPKPFSEYIQPRASLDRLLPAVFTKIGPGPKTLIFLRRSEVSMRRQSGGNPVSTRRQPAGNPAAIRRHRPGKDKSASAEDLHNKNPSLIALGKNRQSLGIMGTFPRKNRGPP